MCLLATEFQINILVSDFRLFVTGNLARLKYATQNYTYSSTGNTRTSIHCKLTVIVYLQAIKTALNFTTGFVSH
jgi:hypothetical protein